MNPDSQNWMDVITFQQEDINSNEKENSKKSSVFQEETDQEIQRKEIREKNNRKKAGLLMGKLHDDMMFLDKIANHPALQKNILSLKDEKAPPKDIDKVTFFLYPDLLPLKASSQVLKEIRGAATDGLKFLEVRKNFWETSEPPTTSSNKRKCLKRSRSEHSSRTRLDKGESNLSLIMI